MQQTVKKEYTRLASLAELSEIKREALKKKNTGGDTRVIVGMGTCGKAAGAGEVLEAVKDELEEKNLKNVEVSRTGCIGLCAREPLLEIRQGNTSVLYGDVDPERAREIVARNIIEGEVVEELEISPDNDFFAPQERIVLKNCGVINPESIEEAIASDTYFALGRALTEMSPEEVIGEVDEAGLRGRGGAGFPTALKWKFAAGNDADDKYIICNADEGDPGAFMDRSILEGDPHKLIEGMVLAGYAVGANTGYIYCRAEYPLAIKRLTRALKQARQLGLLGENIFDSGFNFDLDIRLGAGAFVCGEETALIASIEGRRGEPQPKPPYPANSGLHDKPTVINNVETLANVPSIIRKGSEWFSEIGTEDSPGTKVFALAGKVKNNGLVEIPMGTSLGKIVFDIGGGLEDGADFKAAQTGGPSGGCIPVEHLNTPIDYDSLQELGTIMGSGGLIIMDDRTCMVDLAKYFVDFCKDESCGKCTPCRIGSTRMLEVLERISCGEGTLEDLDLLEEMGERIQDSAFCGLGQTVPNPVLSTMRYFIEEYKEHIEEGYCRSSRCAPLFNSPCQNSCPADVDVPMYINLIRRGEYKEAYKKVQEQNPLVSICGRVCYNLCEGSCNRNSIDEPLAVRELKRFAGDYVLHNEGGFPVPEIEEEKREQIAIVGSGPSGLSAAFYLRRQGYQVKIFEALPVAGGMLAVGIPEYRLPQELLNEELTVLTTMGVEIEIETRIGEDITLKELKEEQGFDAVYLAAGAHNDYNLGIEGEELEGVYPAVELLKEINLGDELDMRGKKAAIIGGGNAAIDAARNAVRLGADEVNIVYRRTKNDMPAHREEIEEAEYEKVNMHCQVNPVKIIGEDGKVSGLECVEIEGGEFDRSGRRKPTSVEGSNFEMDVDIVIIAIGQSVDDCFNSGEVEVKLDGGTVKTDGKGQTDVPWIFAGGDCVTGPSTVVDAVNSGKEAASAIDKFLGGDGEVVKIKEMERKVSGEILEEEKPRVKMPTILLSERRRGFKEVEKGYTEDMAREEAGRCLRCDVEEK